jgi:hypothetical protein
MHLFSDEKELLHFATDFITGRIKLLEKSVKRCLDAPYSDTSPDPFPALLYCFSIVDLLGALLAGNASGTCTTRQSRDYMTQLMGYTEEQARLLQALYRHKLVHLGQPPPVIEDHHRRISWYIVHTQPMGHLLLEKLQEKKVYSLTKSASFEFDHTFRVSITDLVLDIKRSVKEQRGYLDRLERSAELKRNFESAICDIYSINCVTTHRDR